MVCIVHGVGKSSTQQYVRDYEEEGHILGKAEWWPRRNLSLGGHQYTHLEKLTSRLGLCGLDTDVYLC